jgi:hypothetical protein
MQKILSTIVLSTLLIACGEGGGDKNNESNNTNDIIDNNTEDTANDSSSNGQEESPAFILSGYIWRSCTPFTNTSAGYTYTFSETEFVTTYDTYDDNSCSGDPITSIEHNAGDNYLDGSLTTSGGFEAAEIDLHVTSVSGESIPETIQQTLFDIFHIDTTYFILVKIDRLMKQSLLIL